MTAPAREPWRWYLLFVVPFVAPLWVPSYDRVDPTLGGFPFFYWYLLLWIVLSAILSAVVYLATRRAS